MVEKPIVRMVPENYEEILQWLLYGLPRLPPIPPVCMQCGISLRDLQTIIDIAVVKISILTEHMNEVNELRENPQIGKLSSIRQSLMQTKVEFANIAANVAKIPVMK